MEVLRYAAFSDVPNGGNPAGVVLDAGGATEAEMQAVAKEVGFSETVFVVDRNGERLRVRYFSPMAEVPFCGHATIALAVADAEQSGPRLLDLATLAGAVTVTSRADGRTTTASLTSVVPQTADLSLVDQSELLDALGWATTELDPSLPPKVGYAGAWHPIIAASSRERLADLRYDMDLLGALMAQRSWTTVDLVWRESPTVFHCRNPFPPGGVVEDPATGAAAAALGGYLRAFSLIDVPTTVTIHQGHDMGRPGLITVGIPADRAQGISVSGAAIPI